MKPYIYFTIKSPKFGVYRNIPLTYEGIEQLKKVVNFAEITRKELEEKTE